MDVAWPGAHSTHSRSKQVCRMRHSSRFSWLCCPRTIMRRELALTLRAPVTWAVAALSAFLIGHGFVLAVDLYSASSRSALLSQLQMREMDPLAGIVHPTLGGLDLAISVLVPLIAVRALAVEKERRTFGALCLQTGSAQRI